MSPGNTSNTDYSLQWTKILCDHVGWVGILRKRQTRLSGPATFAVAAAAALTPGPGKKGTCVHIEAGGCSVFAWWLVKSAVWFRSAIGITGVCWKPECSWKRVFFRKLGLYGSLVETFSISGGFRVLAPGKSPFQRI